MERRRLGSTGFEVAPLAFGGNVFGWTADEPTSFALLDACVDAGFNLIDTATRTRAGCRGTQGGESEAIIGRWIARRGRHDDVVIATKVGSDMGLGYRVPAQGATSSRRSSSRCARLQVDCIDLYQSHWDDDKTPFEETLEAYQQLLRQGKVKRDRRVEPDGGAAVAGAGGECGARPAALPDAAAAVQPLRPRAASRASCRRCACARTSASSPTSRSRRDSSPASTAPRPTSARARAARASAKHLTPRGLRILAALDAVALRLDATPAQVALAWLMARPGVTAAIASATSLDQFQDLVRATRLRLDADAVAALDAASAP